MPNYAQIKLTRATLSNMNISKTPMLNRDVVAQSTKYDGSINEATDGEIYVRLLNKMKHEYLLPEFSGGSFYIPARISSNFRFAVRRKKAGQCELKIEASSRRYSDDDPDNLCERTCFSRLRSWLFKGGGWVGELALVEL